MKPLSDIPACWTWPMPPLPQPNQFRAVEVWQAGRCAVCGAALGRLLVLDHDHDSGDARGLLCVSCNSGEGRPSPQPVFLLYRERHPTLMLGVRVRYRVQTHPLDRTAFIRLEGALTELERRDRGWKRHWEAAEFAEALGWPIPEPWPWLTSEPDDLMKAALRVGLTLHEWMETESWRIDAELDLRSGYAARPHPRFARKLRPRPNPAVAALDRLIADDLPDSDEGNHR